MMPLAMVAPGEEVRLTAIRGGRRMRQRLADLGLNPGLTVRVVQCDPRGLVAAAIGAERKAFW